MKIDVKDLDIDMLSASAHKFNGPKGIGFLYIRKGVPLSSYADGGAQESNRRAGTENIASIVGMATALKGNCSSLEQNRADILKLEKQFLQGLNEAGTEYIRNGGSITLPGLISISFPNKSGEAILHRLDLLGISISTGAACDSVNTRISHVLESIKLQEYVSKGTIRISIGKDNTAMDVQTIVAELKRMLLM